MEGTLLLISVLVFIVIMLLVSSIYLYLRHLRERHDLIKRVKEEEKRPEIEGKGSFLQIVKNNLMGVIGALGNRVKPTGEGELSHLRKTFLKAGYRGSNTAVVFFGAKTLFAVLFAFGFILLKLVILENLAPLQLMLIAILLALFGFYLPDLWLRMKISARKEEIARGFPDALDLLVVCVEAGVGLDAALYRVGEEMRLSNKTLSEELRLLSLELRAGKTRRDALRNLAMRTDLEDVSSFVTLLIQTDKFGTSLAQAVRVQSESMRRKRFQKAEEMAAKLPVKLVFPLILCIFPALFIVVLGPAAIRIIRTLLPALSK
jgi:tight adherence protein C